MQVKGQSACRLKWKVVTLLVSLCVFIEETKGQLTCTYEVLADNSVDDNYRVDELFVPSQSACQQVCTNSPACTVVVYQDPSCRTYEETFLTPQSDGGWTYMKKLSCSSATTTTTASTPTTSTAAPTTTTASTPTTSTAVTFTTTQLLTSSPTVTSPSPPPPPPPSPTTTAATTPTTTPATTTATTTATTAQTTTPSTTAPTTTTSTSTTQSDFRMERKFNTSSTDAPAYRIESIGQCEAACRLVTQCQAYALNTTTCTLYTATRYISSVRVKSSGFSETSNMTGDDRTSLSYSPTLESCEGVCLRSRLCKAVVFDSSGLTCSLYSSLPAQQDDNPSLTLSWKLSDEGEVFTFTSKNDGGNGSTRLSSTSHMCFVQLVSGLLASVLLSCH